MISLEIAKKLKDAGWPQHGRQFGYHEGSLVCYFGKVPYLFDIAAPTVEELLAELPKRLLKIETSPKRNSWKNVKWGATCNDKAYAYHQADSLVEALAILWLELKEKKLI